MNTSSSITEIAKALSAFQGENIIVGKDAKAGKPGGRQWKYATLDSILEVVRPILSRHGLSVIQLAGPGTCLTTTVLHTSGEYISESFDLSIIISSMVNTQETRSITSAQALGMVFTYVRRYTLCAVLGITTDEDLDGENVSTPNGKSEKAKPMNRNGLVKEINRLGSDFYMEHWNDDPETGAKPNLAAKFSKDRVTEFNRLNTKELQLLCDWLAPNVDQYGDYLMMREAKKQAEQYV